MKKTTSLSTMARFGAFTVLLGTAALTGLAQSSSSPATTGSTTAQERASDRATERASDRSALKRDVAAATGMSRQDQKFIEKFTAANQREIALSQLALERATNPQVKAFAQKMVSAHSMAGHEFMTVASGGTLTTDSSLAASTSERASSMKGASTTSGSNSDTTTSGSATSGSTAAGVATRGTDATGHKNSKDSLSASTTERATASASDRTRSTASSAMAMDTGDAKNHRMYKKLMGKTGEEFDETYMKAMVDEHENAVEMLEDLVKDEDRNAQLRAFANKTLPNLRAHLSEAQQIEKSID